MKASLTFETEKIKMSKLGEDLAFPDLVSGLNVQNKAVFDLEENDEIFEGYGKLSHVYPYRQYTCYDRIVQKKELKTAVLENDYLKAVFLPELGGRLWRLIDKSTGVNLLYTNDVIRPSNLATRNAWFSGGVEWNVGIIGHTPLTMEPLFTAVLENENHSPVLRMYEFERIRRVTYQMDFWLEENSRFLYCRMRIVNHTQDVTPMYWWSNMAVPEYEKGRIFVPAEEAYTSDLNSVYKVKIPYVDGKDISKYQDIPDQVDYFFHIPEEEKKYIANLNQDGYGLVQFSTNRLRSRKLFSWGHNDASARWQEFLTDQAGDYIEIQAGIGKTQYGCIPMAPHTAWEWMELYGPIEMEPELTQEEYGKAIRKLDEKVQSLFEAHAPQKRLEETKALAKKKGKVICRGSGYGNLENLCQQVLGERGLDSHLDFESGDERQKEWIDFLESGELNCPDPKKRPGDFTKDDFWFEQLKNTAEGNGKENWYVQYQLGLQYLYRGRIKKAKKALLASRKLEKNVWADHALAICCMMTGEEKQAIELLLQILEACRSELPIVKECMRILIQLKAYSEILELYKKLPLEIAGESRIYFTYLQALAGVGEYEKAYTLLSRDGGLEIDDIREGDGSLDQLWNELCANLFPEGNRKILHKLNFKSLP